MQLKIDPEFQSLIPPLSPDEFRQLEENILKDGCRDPLVYWNDTIIDGHNRFKICTQYGIKYSMNQMKFDSREKAIEWIIMNQFGRRNLQAVDRVKLSLKLEYVIKEVARKNQLRKPESVSQELGKQTPVHTNQKLAEIAGVSDETVRRYKVIQRDADEEMKKKVDTKEYTINKAFEKLKKPVAQIKSEPTSEPKIGFKVCTLCRKEKPLDDFPRSGGIECKVCKNSRSGLGLTIAQARELGPVDEELDRFYEEMKNPSPVQPGNELNKRSIDPIIAELETVLKPFRNDITKFVFMPTSRGGSETKDLIQIIINDLSKIYSKIKE